MKRNLLLVGPGYLGQEILREFETAGWDVTTASRSGSSNGYKVNISDRSQVEELAKKLSDEDKLPSHVIHCASASAGRGASMEKRLQAYEDVYKNGCENLTSAFSGAHVLFTSSSSVYGQSDGSVVTEESLTEPIAETAKILVVTEQTILSSNGTVARLSGIYGHEKSYLLKRLFSGEAVMDGGGERVLNHIHHRDGAKACLLLLEKGLRGVYNVSETTNLTLKETYTALCEMFSISMPSSEPATHTTRLKLNKRVSNQKLLDQGWELEFPSFLDSAPSVATSMNLIQR